MSTPDDVAPDEPGDLDALPDRHALYKLPDGVTDGDDRVHEETS